MLAVLLVLVIAVTAALGTWQIERRAWKLALIAAVDARVHAAPVGAPGPPDWSTITAQSDAYRRVRVTGSLENSRETLVQAVTGRGPGSWLLTPLRTDAGWAVLVNRGFVPEGTQPSRPAGRVTVTGLLRNTEPKGAVFRANYPAANRWYSRDVGAIARARHVRGVAPYFIDADATANARGYPVGGLTVIAFRNAHLSYALTWFALAGMSAWGLWIVLRTR